jgi:multiubiquitin
LTLCERDSGHLTKETNVSEHDHEQQQEHHGTPIHIDRKTYFVHEPTITGAELRLLPETLIGDDYDLFLEVPGGQDDLIEDDEAVEIKPGLHFFSVQKTINPGA